LRYFLAVFLLIGVYVVGTSVHAEFQSINARSWHHTEGNIQDSSFLIAGSKPGTSTQKVIYSYVVNGVDYKNDRVAFGIGIASDKQSLDYYKGQHVQVYYDPDNPIRSVLRPNDTHAIIFGSIVGFIFILFSILGYYVDRKKANNI